MKRTKILIFILFFIFICLFIHSNELKVYNQNKFFMNFTNKISFNSYEYFIQNSMTNNEITNSKKGKDFLYMGIIGSGLLGLGTALTITGIPLMAAYAYAGNLSIYIEYIGCAIFLIGILVFIIGLPIMITGFVLSWYYKKRISSFNEADIKNGIILTGIAIKI